MATKNITDIAAKRLKPGTYITDGHPYRGLRLICNDGGTKSWIYRYVWHGKQKQVVLGHYPDDSLTEARTRLLAQKKLRGEGIDPQVAAKNAAQPTFTMGEMVSCYLSERTDIDRAAKGAAEVRRMMEADIIPIAGLTPEQCTAEVIHATVLGIKGRAPDTARRFRAELGRAWNFALGTGRCRVANPITRETGGTLRQGRRDRVLKTHEVADLLRWMDNYSDTVADVLRTVLYTGMRSGEVVGLMAADFTELDDGWWVHIPAGRMKSGREHKVPLCGVAGDILIRRLEAAKDAGATWLFPSTRGGHIQQKVVGVEVYAHSGRSTAKVYAGKAVCPVSGWTVHDLRRTARTILGELGCPFEIGEALLAHTLPGVAATYNHAQHTAARRNWLEKLGAFLNGLAADKVVSINAREVI